MNKRLIRMSSYFLCFLFLLNIAGCWNRRELNTLAIVTGLGMDQASDDPSKIQLTAQIANPGELRSSSKRDTGGGGKAFWNVTDTGNTLFTTLRDFTHESNRKLYFPHIQVIILGHDLAEKGVQEQLDFFARDHEARLNNWILVSDKTAREALEIVPELDKLPSMNISQLVEAQKATSQSPEITLLQFMSRLMSKTTAPIAPLIKIKGEGQNKALLVEGTGVFKKDKLVGELDKTETRGLLWVLDKVKGGIIDVNCPDDQSKISLEIQQSKTKVTPEINDDQIMMKIDIEEEGTIGTQYCQEEIISPEKIKVLEEEESKAITEEIMTALKKAQKLNADIFGFGDFIHQHYRNEWVDLENKWDELFPNVEVEVTVDCKVRRAGRTTKPPMPEKE